MGDSRVSTSKIWCTCTWCTPLEPFDDSDVEMQRLNPTNDELPLFQNCRAGDWDMVFEEINRYKSTEYFKGNTADYGKTILHYVSNLENIDEATKLVRKLFNKLEELPYYEEFDLEEFVNAQTSDTQYTALHYAIDRGNKQVVEDLILNGADVNLCTKKGKKDALGLIYDRLHFVMVTLFDLDYTIGPDKYSPSNQNLWKIHCDFTSIAGVATNKDGKNKYAHLRQSTLLAEVLRQPEAKQTLILLHPLVQVFLYQKRDKMWPIWISMFYRVICSIVLVVFLSCNFFKVTETETAENFTDYSSSKSSVLANSSFIFSVISSQFVEDVDKICLWGPYIDNGCRGFNHSLFFYVCVFLWLSMVFIEILEFKLSPSKTFYIDQLENVGQICVIFITLTSTIFSIVVRNWELTENSELKGWRNCIFILDTAGIGLCALLVQGQLTKFEPLGIYNQMLIMVLWKFAKFFVAFLPMLVAFFIIFHRLLPQNFPNEWGLGFAKILAMTTGELNYDDLFLDEAENEKVPEVYLAAAKLTMIVFVLSVTILLQNLLLGLTINDIEKLKEKALVKHLAANLELIYLTEQILVNEKFMRYASRCSWYKSFLESLQVKSTTKEDVVDGTEDKPFTISLGDLPQKTQKSIISFENKKEEPNK